MKTSVRRHNLRLLLGVNRKLRAIRWIGGSTVGVVCTSRVSNRGTHYVKADKGVEKSCRTNRRRRRGLRRGRRRSRGGKPRSTRTPPTPRVKDRSPRVLIHGERLFTAARRDQQYLFALADPAWRKGALSNIARKRLASTWSVVAHKYPYNVSLMLFGRSAKHFLDTIDPSLPELPPLPPRRGAPPRVLPTRDVVGMDRSQVQKDGLGSDPCRWCADEYGGDSTFCLKIQRCVRNPKTIERRSNPSSRGKKVMMPPPTPRRPLAPIRCHRRGDVCWGLACECQKR